MQNHSEQDISPADVMPAMSRFLKRHDLESFLQAPENVQEMFNHLMDTDYGDDPAYRQRHLLTLSILKDFGNTLKPFSQQTINVAANL